jgi:hypothetical protein
MPDAIERALQSALASGTCHIGEIAIRSVHGRYSLMHREDVGRTDLASFGLAEDAIAIARLDDAGKYRPLKTAPNLRRGWQLEIATLAGLRRALDYLYPGRLAVFAAWKDERLTTTPLRETLDRQSGMYRVASQISDQQIDEVVGDFCRSDGGCLRTILWRRDEAGAAPSIRLPAQKFDPDWDQAGGPGSAAPAIERMIPLLCQEACTLLVSECRAVVKGKDVASKRP